MAPKSVGNLSNAGLTSAAASPLNHLVNYADEVLIFDDEIPLGWTSAIAVF